MKTHNDPLFGLLVFVILGILIGLIVFGCAVPRKPEESLCLKPCSTNNVLYVEAIASKDLYVMVMYLRGFDPAEETIAYAVFDLRKDYLTKAMKYAICNTVSVELESKYELQAADQDLIIIKGVIACRD